MVYVCGDASAVSESVVEVAASVEAAAVWLGAVADY